MSSHLRVLRRVLAVALIITFIVSIVPPRVHAASYTVTNCNPSGAGSLRQAIVDANGHAGPDEITFNITCNRITLSSPIFPNITGDLTITGPGADSLTIDGAGQYRVFVITSGVNVTISGLTIQNAGSSGTNPILINSGGTLTVQNSVFKENKAGTGGAIYNNNGTLTVSNSAFINNKATYDSGAIHNYGMLSVSNSTFSGNSSSANGGAILHAGSGNTATITNSTFFGNFSGNGRGGGNAGAIYNAATLTLIHGTVSGNSTEVYGGGIDTIGTLYIRNSIVDGNSAQNGFNIHGSYIGTNNLIDTDPQLSPLQDNGGPTQTMMPLPGSPAIDRANAAYCPSTDQRGVARPVDGDGDGTPACDIGAVEAPGITPVRVQSITRGDPSPTNAANVGFTVTFDAAVTGVSAGNFALVAGGPSGASITGVSGSGTTWTVAANTATGDGTLRLDMVNATGVSGPGDAPVANVPFTTGEPYTIDKTAPTVSLSSLNADPTNTNISVTVTFSEGITGFDASDVVVSNGMISHFAGTGTSYTVVVVPGVDGLVSVDIPAGAAHDAAGNPTLAARLERTYDGTPPAVTVEQAAAQSDPTRTSPIVFTVTFSEDVPGFDASDVQLSGTAGATIATVSGGPAIYTVEVSGMTADGTVSAALLAGAAVDRAGNHSAPSTSSDNIVTYDTTAPTVTLSSTAPDPATIAPIPVTATFSEVVTGFGASDVAVGNGAVSNFTGSGASYSFDVIPSADGMVTVAIPAGAAHDAAGNPTAASAQLARTFDGTAPAVSINQAATQADPTSATPIVFTVEFSEDVTGFDASDVILSGTAGATTAAVSGGPAVYTVEVSGMTAFGTVRADLGAGAASDHAGQLSAASTSTDNTVTYIDGNAPGVLVDPLALSVLEGGPAQPYTVRLASCPLAGEIVTVTIAPAAGVSTDRTTLTFDQTTWNTPQAVSVSAPDNAVADGSRISSIAHAVSSSDPSTPYGDGSVSAPPVAITIQDDDAPGIIIIETEGRTAVLPGGPADTYTVALAMQPAAGDTVTIALAYDSTRLDVTPTSLDFDDATWNTPQTVAVQAIHTGGSSPGAPTSPIVHTASSSSGSPYAGVTATVIVHLTSADPAPAGSTAADHARAQAPLCANLDGSTTDLVRADVPSDTVAQGSVFCRALVENGALRSGENLAEIGVPAVLARGVLQAVDVFGLDHSGHSVSHFTAPVRVCLRGDGALLYLDATTAPRQMRELVAVLAEGYTCATIPNAGTVVLVERGPASYPPADAPESPIVPGGCMVRTLRILNLRAAPDVSSEVLALVPYDVTLSVTGRQGEWFQVDYLGVRGWLSAAYLAPRGACEP